MHVWNRGDHLTKPGQVDYDWLTLGQLKLIKISLSFVLFIHITIFSIYWYLFVIGSTVSTEYSASFSRPDRSQVL